jgi:hypothetical protein
MRKCANANQAHDMVVNFKITWKNSRFATTEVWMEYMIWFLDNVERRTTEWSMTRNFVELLDVPRVEGMYFGQMNMQTKENPVLRS